MDALNVLTGGSVGLEPKVVAALNLFHIRPTQKSGPDD